MSDLLERGAFVLSIDTELAWGGVHKREGDRSHVHGREREVIDQLLQLFESYEIHATWAIVGHLFLRVCHPSNGRKHPEIVRPSYSWFVGDWFDDDPCANVEMAPSWYGRDIVERVRQCSAPQEIGSHGFSHTLVGDPGCTPESFDSELKACRKLADEIGVALVSFVFPGNSIGYLEVLAQNGFIAYRGRTPVGSRRRVVRQITSPIWPLPRPGVYPEFRQGLWNIPATHFYGFTDRRSLLPIGARLYILKQRLRQAARQKSLIHLWFHPHNLTPDPIRSLRGLEVIFQEVDRLRRQGELENPTIGELASSLLGKHVGTPAT